MNWIKRLFSRNKKKQFKLKATKSFNTKFNSIHLALEATKGFRKKGLTLDINGKFYWFKNGIEDIDLVFKGTNDWNELNIPRNTTGSGPMKPTVEPKDPPAGISNTRYLVASLTPHTYNYPDFDPTTPIGAVIAERLAFEEGFGGGDYNGSGSGGSWSDTNSYDNDYSSNSDD